MRQAQECAVRQVIDEAAALALGVEPPVLVDSPAAAVGRGADDHQCSGGGREAG